MSLFSIPPSDPRFTESVDIDALYARPSSTPSRDLTPPSLLSVAPPLVEEPEGEITRAHRILGFVQKTSRRARLLAAGGGVLLLLLGLGAVLAASGSAQAKTAIPQPIAIANVIEAPPPPPAALPLPPPPTTGALGSPKAPPVRPAKPKLVKLH